MKLSASVYWVYNWFTFKVDPNQEFPQLINSSIQESVSAFVNFTNIKQKIGLDQTNLQYPTRLHSQQNEYNSMICQEKTLPSSVVCDMHAIQIIQ